MQQTKIEDTEMDVDVKCADGTPTLLHDAELLRMLLPALRQSKGWLLKTKWKMVGSNENVYDLEMDLADSRTYSRRFTFTDASDTNPVLLSTGDEFKMSEMDRFRNVRDSFMLSHIKYKIVSIIATLK
mgnify:FL=1